MRHKLTLLLVGTLFSGTVVPVAHAQRGVGAPMGVARQPDQPKTVTLVGTVAKVETGPCENSTGRALAGTHFLLKIRKGQTLNIHLGPANVVAFVADDLTKGMKITVEAFRTKKMKKGHYVAKSLVFDDRTVKLRDDTLQPVWAGGRGAGSTLDGFSRGAGWRGAGWRGTGGRGAGWRGAGWRGGGAGWRGGGAGWRGGPGRGGW
jgi:hypothetical protein